MNRWILTLLSSLLLFANGHTEAEVLLQASYSVESTWSHGYTASITLKNTSDQAIQNWRAQFNLPIGQTISSVWNARFTVQEDTDTQQQHVSISNESWNNVLLPEETVRFGFQVNNPFTLPPGFQGLIALGDGFVNSDQDAFALEAQYSVNNVWDNGYEVLVTLINPTDQLGSTWVASFSLPETHKISSFWNGEFNVEQDLITVRNPTWSTGNAISAKGAVTFGFVVEKHSGELPAILGLLAMANANETPPNITVPIPPELFPIIVSEAFPRNYTVSWRSVNNADYYLLEESRDIDFTDPIVVLEGAALSQQFQNRSDGTYYYRVSAGNAAGLSDFSNIEYVTIETTPVDITPPLLFSIQNSEGNASYSIEWSPVEGAQGYVLEESQTSDFAFFSTLFSGNLLSFNVENRTPGIYFYRVKSFNGNEDSDYSNIVSTVVEENTPVNTPIIESYWESWNSSDPVDEIVAMQVDIINISFGTFERTGEHQFRVIGVEANEETLNQLIALAHQAGKKVKLSIGGATYPLSGLLLDDDDAYGMAQAVKTYIEQYELDGVDYDIEDYPAPNLQTTLIRNTREVLGGNYIISYTPKTPAATTYPYSEVIPAAHPYLDHISIMAYNYGPGYTYESDIDQMVSAGVPASKINIGLMPGFDDIGRFTSLEDIVQASRYIKERGLAGIMFWDLNRDLSNITGLGSKQATETAWSIFHSE
ncbi:MAG: hypothetical protein Tsb0021_01170 [Chlamydiales bacterium]